MTGLQIEPKQSGDDLCTPFWITDSIASAEDILLDPCANRWSTVPAEFSWSLPEHDGLAEEWLRDRPGIVFVNPPYGRGHLARWAIKSIEESHAEGRCVALLVPCDPSTKAWAMVQAAARAVVYLRGRVRFCGPASTGAGTFASALVLLGDARLSMRICAEFVADHDVRWMR